MDSRTFYPWVRLAVLIVWTAGAGVEPGLLFIALLVALELLRVSLRVPRA